MSTLGGGVGFNCDVNGVCWFGTPDYNQYEVVRSYGHYSLAINHQLADIIGSSDTVFYESCDRGCDSTTAFTYL